MNNIQLNIKHIDIEDLFGIYCYSIPMNKIDISKLLILYGDNGVGKTTILEIIFNLLSSEHAKGHKTELANTKFKRISITLSNNYTISAYRKKTLLGDYQLSLKKDTKVIIDIPCITLKEDNEYVVRDGNKGYMKVDNFLDTLAEMNLSIHYLSDDRKVKSNLNMILNEQSNELRISNFPDDIIREISIGRSRGKTFSLSDILLKTAIKQVEKWFENKATLGTTIGQNEIQDIYFNLIEELLDDSESVNENNTSDITKKDILLKLTKLNIRNQEFMKYKLTLDYNLDKYINIIGKTSNNKLATITNILKPYIDGIEKNLNAMEEIKSIIDIFITTLNDFYTGKELEFSIDEGLKIVSTYKPDEYLTPSMLSSGEKQLLLLFCNTITAREQASIFIIDEPELSLNVKWQRKLIEALLIFAEGSSIQFILASHSIELLTKYNNHVSKLENIKV